MSRYENRVHEPAFVWVEKMADALKVPAAYFYCADDRLAEIMLIYSTLSENKCKTLYACATDLIAAS